MMTDWAGITALLLWGLSTLLVFVGRQWLISRITKSVEHDFNIKLEKLRADLRTTEEYLKSELRDKEAEISVLRTNLLSGSANRQTLLDKRRFEAVEHVWTAVNDLAPLKSLNLTASILNMSEISKEAHKPNIQQFLSMISQGAPDVDQLTNVARDDQPFLPELAWAYYNAYRTTIMSTYMRFNTFKIGIENPDKFLNFDHLRNVLKTALPTYTQWIDQNKPESYYDLLDELERLLLNELRNVLDGKEADQATIAKAHAITDALRKAAESQAQADLPSV